jgi:hypothetical protein
MKRHATLIMIILALAVLLLPASAFSQTTGVAGAGAGTLPAGTSMTGVSLSGLNFGMGVIIPGDNTADGQFQAMLLGTTLLGLAQNIQVQGEVDSGTLGTGSRTFSGLATVDMGDGTPLLTNVPFTVTATATSVALLIGATNLPAATLTAGSIIIQ